MIGPDAAPRPACETCSTRSAACGAGQDGAEIQRPGRLVDTGLGEADYAAGVAGVMALPVADLQEEADPWPVKALASEFDKQLS